MYRNTTDLRLLVGGNDTRFLLQRALYTRLTVGRGFSVVLATQRSGLAYGNATRPVCLG